VLCRVSLCVVTVERLCAARVLCVLCSVVCCDCGVSVCCVVFRCVL
jgi:hypothetical protein